MKPGGEFDPIVLLWEIQVEILSWLPVKTLMQFKCVCKSWKSLISDNKSFQKLHLHRSARNKHVLLTLLEISTASLDKDDQDLCFVPCPMRRLVEDPSSMIDEDGCCNLKGKYSVLDSCNGLVCFDYTLDYADYPRFRFWNPATRLWSKKSPTFTSDFFTRFGFGYDDSRDTYKVVGISDCCSSEVWKWETVVYSMGDSCWRKISSKHSFRLSPQGYDGQFAGGCLNWLAEDELNKPNQNLPSGERVVALVILSFDMRKETYRSLSLPEDTSVVSINTITKLSVLGNCLCLFQDSKRTHFNVWQMREYGVRESWARLVTVSYEHLQCHDPMFSPLPLMCLSEDGDILMLFRNYNRDYIIYNLRDNSLKNVQLPANKCWFGGHGYVQSLVSPY